MEFSMTDICRCLYDLSNSKYSVPLKFDAHPFQIPQYLIEIFQYKICVNFLLSNSDINFNSGQNRSPQNYNKNEPKSLAIWNFHFEYIVCSKNITPLYRVRCRQYFINIFKLIMWNNNTLYDIIFLWIYESCGNL